MAGERMPIPTRHRCLELGASFLEHDLDKMRQRSVEMYEVQRDREGDAWDGRVRPQTSSHEADLMKAVEWATAAATLRLLAEQARTAGS